MARVLGAGLIVLDHVFLTNKAIAQVGATEYIGSSGGGSVGNTLAMLSVLGHSTNITGVVGQDPTANAVRADFSAFGVDSSRLVARTGIHRGIKTRQFSHVIYPSGKHSFRDYCLRCGNSFAREIGLVETDVTRDLLRFAETCEVLHVDRANAFTLTLAKKCAAKGIPVSFDYTFKPYGKAEGSVEQMLANANLVKISADLFAKVARVGGREGLLKWRELFPETSHLVVTRGDQGVFGFAQIGSGKPTYELPGIPSKPFKEAGGAGDVLVACLIDQLLLKPGPSDEEDVIRRINRAQALASLDCAMYGARSLQRVLRDQEVTSDQVWQLADETVRLGQAVGQWSSKSGLPSRPLLGFTFEPGNACDVCGLSVRNAKKSRKPERKRLEYRVSLGRAPGAMSESYSIGRAQYDLLSRFRDRSAIFIGSGGSLSAAAFGEYFLWHQSGKPSRAMPPYEFLGLTRLDPGVAVWLLSYGGSNPDIIAAAEHARRLRVKDCLVLTGTKGSQLAKMANEWNWQCVVLPGQERSFVATVGMLAMVSAIAGLLSEPNRSQSLEELLDYPNLLDTFFRTDRLVRDKLSVFPEDLSSIHVIGLSSGWGWPALVDLESKLVEGGLCTVEITELKNFTHGRYVGALERRRQNKLVILRTPENAELADFITRKMHRYLGTLVLSTDYADSAGGIDLILKVLFLADHLAKRVGKDISNPKYPPEARGLYGWAPSNKSSVDDDTLIG